MSFRSRTANGPRPLAALAAALTLVAASAANALSPTTPSPGEMSLGSPQAPVTVVEYASVGCPHCAVWANDVFPDFRKKYVDTGKVRFVFREMLTGNGLLAAAGFLTARCAAPDRYFQIVDDIFAQQSAISAGGVEVLEKIAEHGGLTREKFTACLQDQVALKALAERTRADAEARQVTGTPTFFVGDKRLDGEQTLEDLGAAIAAAHPLAAARR